MSELANNPDISPSGAPDTLMAAGPALVGSNASSGDEEMTASVNDVSVQDLDETTDSEDEDESTAAGPGLAGKITLPAMRALLVFLAQHQKRVHEIMTSGMPELIVELAKLRKTVVDLKQDKARLEARVRVLEGRGAARKAAPGAFVQDGFPEA